MITDGNITDLQLTIDAIVSISHEPVSIVIVGVGDEDFTNMVKLDGDVGMYTVLCCAILL